MVDWPIFVLGMSAVSIVVAAVRAISREDQAARSATERGAADDQPRKRRP